MTIQKLKIGADLQVSLFLKNERQFLHFYLPF